MRGIFVSGGSVLTTNAIARQLFLYASLLADQGRTDTVDFPVIVDGETTNCTLLVGAHLALAAVTVPRTEAGTLAGEDSALFELQRRCDEVRLAAARTRPSESLGP
ncbi:MULTISPECIES: hypothetical protein [Microbacterium]|uniref:hypothetical protein n=1 Tax=Microbacterium TaxID=33882 RepID=UPI00277DF31A|nr:MULTISPECIES: hypothetical protein [Microbacterium]MDQ1085368.1 hypothetical protein [Microbacterium sp. SORGH_AS_0344]MDQ1169327.1 hypothetical protein [Microbacterium proteolyticum]